MSNLLFIFYGPCLLFIYHRFQSRNFPLFFFFPHYFNNTGQLSLSIPRLHQFCCLQCDPFISVCEVSGNFCCGSVALWKSLTCLHRKCAGLLLCRSWAHFVHSGVFMKNYLLNKRFCIDWHGLLNCQPVIKIGSCTLMFLRDAYEQHSAVVHVWVENIIKNTARLTDQGHSNKMALEKIFAWLQKYSQCSHLAV